MSINPLSGSFAQALDPRVLGPGRAVAIERRALATRVQRLVAVAVVPMVLVTMWWALTSDYLARPLAAGLYWSYMTAAPLMIGLYWWTRRPASRFGPLLVALAFLTWIVSWQGASSRLAFDVGVLAEAPFWLLTLYLFLSLPLGRAGAPMGRGEPRVARWMMAALGIGALATFVPWALLSPVIAGGGPLTSCAPNCPENVLQVGSFSSFAQTAGDAETYISLTLVAAVFVVYLARLLGASRPQRRALMAVAVTSLLFLPAYFAFNFSAWILKLERPTLDVLAWGIVGTRVLLPLGFLVALLQAERFAAGALRALLTRLAGRPTPAHWRDAIADALDDRALQLGFWDPATQGFREPSGDMLSAAATGAHRAWVPVDRDGEPVAAMVIDETLTEDPELVAVAVSATLLAVENGALEGELRASRARILEAGHAERRRIERDLHDSAQQRLVALRIHLALAGEQLERPREREMLERLGVEGDEAIDELRDVAHGIYPQLLSDFGIGSAVEEAARRSPISVDVRNGGLTRYAEEVEAAVYFCCLECLQNVAKHAGPHASATVRLSEYAHRVTFSVE